MRTAKILALVLALAAAPAVTLAPAAADVAAPLDIPAGTYVAEKTHASVIWKVNHFGYSTYTGFLNRDAVAATVELDPADVAKSTLEVTIDGQQIETLHALEADPRKVDFNAEIESEQFLNTVANREITFNSQSIEITGPRTARIHGELTLNGQTRPLALEATLNQANVNPMLNIPMFGISATGVIKRSDFGVSYLVGPVGDEVTLEIQAEFHKS